MRCAQLLPAIACSIAWTLGPVPANAAEVAKPSPAKGVSVSFGNRGELIIDGKPRFIRGGYRSGDGDNLTERLSSAADAGFDLIHDYRFESMNVSNGVDDYVQTARGYLRRADELGLGVFLGLPREAVKQGDEQAITQIVKTLSSEHALWMWYLYDEPNPNKVSPEAV